MAASTSGTDKPESLNTFLAEVGKLIIMVHSFIPQNKLLRSKVSYPTSPMIHTLVQGEGNREEGCCVDISTTDRQTAQAWLHVLQPQSICGQKVKT